MSQYIRTNSTSSQNDHPRKKNILIVSWVIIIVLSACCLYLYVSRAKIIKNNDAALIQRQQAIDATKTDRVYLQADFDAASAEIDQLMSKNVRLNDTLQADKAAIADLRTQVKTILSNNNATQAELMKARSMIYLLGNKAQAYELYIAELEKDNTIITGTNQLLSKERDETVEKNIALHMAGRVLHAYNIRMELIHKNRMGQEKETSKAKKVDEMKITFDIDENRIAESGTKQIYLRIIAPDGGVFYSLDYHSGLMKTINGDEITYSALEEIDITKNQPLKGVTVEWLLKSDYVKGNYKIELYNEGYKIGSGMVEMK